MKISKRLLLGGLVGILLSSCSLLKDPSITVDYAGEFCVNMLNEDGGVSRACVFW